MCGTDDVVALDFPGVCGVALFLWESALGETHLVNRGVDYLSSRVVGLSLNAPQARSHPGICRVFHRQEVGAVRAMEEIV